MATAEAIPDVDLDAPLSNEWGFECVRLRLPAEWRLTEDIFLKLCAPSTACFGRPMSAGSAQGA